MANSRPNVIVIVSDTFRPDHLSINGHPFCQTPELDAFVSQGITFDSATVSSFPTIPMRTDWFTGRFSHLRHGWQDLASPGQTLPAILRRAGYTTQLIADNTHMLRSGFWKPFTHFQFLRGHEGDKPLSRLNDPVKRAITDLTKTRVEKGAAPNAPTLADLHVHTNAWRRYEDQSQIAQLADVACRWIEDNHQPARANASAASQPPFMLWMDCFDVHEAWCPPQYLWRKYDPDYDGQLMIHPNYGSADAYTPAELKNMGALYAGMCTLLSKHVGRVLRVVADAGLMENTIVVFMSDHGMYLGERGRTGKSLINREETDVFPFHRELTHICWSMHVPPSLGLKTVAPGSRLPHLAQAPDLLPTLMELCGVEPPQDLAIEGASLLGALLGRAEAHPRKIAVTAATGGSNFCRRPTVTDGKWTLLISEPPKPEPPKLYHTAVDPGQAHDCLADHLDQAQRLHAELLAWLKENGAGASALAQTLDRLSAANCGLA